MPISNKLKQIIVDASWIRKMFEEGARLKAERGAENIFDLSLGNPVLDPPEAFRQALRDLVEAPVKGQHRYMMNAGYDETREAVAQHLTRESGKTFDAGQVIMTVGAGGGLNVIFKTILDAGDEVIIIRPFFPEYNFYIDNHGGVAVPVDCQSDFGLDLAAIGAAIGEKTRAVVLNSPNNPAGNVYPAEQVAALGSLLTERSSAHGRTIYLVGDEPYRKITYDGVTVPWIFEHYAGSLQVTSHSKDLGLPGERIGYIAIGPEVEGRQQLFGGMVFANRTLGFVNAPAFMQRVVAGLQDVRVEMDGYTGKRDRLYEQLTACGYDVVKPQGAFYMFPKALEQDDVRFVRALQEHNVLVVPGTGFGMPGYFRISYAVDDWVVDGALAGFSQVAEEYKAQA